MDAARDPSEFRKVLQPFIARPIEDRLLDLYCANPRSPPEPHSKGTSDMCSRDSLADVVRSVRIPTLIITGKSDPLMPSAYIPEEVLAYFPHARVVWLPCGHEITYEMPAETAALLEAFLAGVQGAPVNRCGS